MSECRRGRGEQTEAAFVGQRVVEGPRVEAELALRDGIPRHQLRSRFACLIRFALLHDVRCLELKSCFPLSSQHSSLCTYHRVLLCVCRREVSISSALCVKQRLKAGEAALYYQAEESLGPRCVNSKLINLYVPSWKPP